jgi:hypothetical protein
MLRKLFSLKCMTTTPGCIYVYSFLTTCKSGVYKIYPKNTSGFKVYCEMEKNGGGWTVSGDKLFAAFIKW